MAAQSLLAKLGMRTGITGSAASLAVAFALANGDPSMAAHTSAARMGMYADRTAAAEKIGHVVMGAEVFSTGVAVVTASVPMRVSAPGTAAATLTLDDSDSSNFTVISMTRSGAGFWDMVGSNSQFYIRDSDQGRNVFVYTTGPSTSATWDVSAKLNTQASTTSQAGLNVDQGVAPTSPVNGDVWITSAGMFCRAGGVTSGPFGSGGGGSIGGSIATDQIAVGTGVNTIGGSTDFTFAAGVFSVGAPANLPTPLSAIRMGGSDSDVVGAYRGYNAESTVEFKVDLGGSISGTEPTWVNKMVIEGNRNNGITPLLFPSTVVLSSYNGGIEFTTTSTRNVRLSVMQDGGIDWTGLTTGAQPALSAANHGTIYYDKSLQNFYASKNGAAYALIGGTGTIAGTIAVNQVAYGSGTDAIQGSAGFTFVSGALALSSTTVGQLSIQQINGGANVQLTMDAGSTASALVQYKSATVNTWQQFANASQMGWFDNAGAWTAFKLQQGTASTGYASALSTKVASSTTAGGFVVGDGATTVTNVAIGGGIIRAGTAIYSAASTTALAGLNLDQGTAPSAPVDGDVWITTAGMFVRANGVTVGPLAAGGGNLSGTLTATRVPFASGASTLTDSAKFTFSATTGLNVNMASSGANNLNLGTSSGTALTSGARNTTVGQSAFAAATTTSDTVAIGYQAALVSNGSQSVYIGSGAGATFAGTFGSNVIIGFQAGGGTGASTSSVTLVGNQAGNLCQAANTTAIGNAALIALTTGLHNVAVGSSALGTQVTGTDCTALGENALALTTVSHNTVIGSNSGAIISTGHSNTIVGSNAGTVTTTGVGNIFLGRGAGDGTALGASNRFVAGGGAQPIQDVWFGNGELQGSPSSYTIHGSGGLGANVGGASVTLAGGISTGNAAGGSVIFQTARSGVSSSSPNTLTTRLSVIEDGRIEWTGITTVNAPSASAANNGAIFYDSTLQGLYYSYNGASYLPLVSSGITGSLTSGRVPFANGASSLTDSGTFLFSTTNGLSVKRSAAVRCEMFGDSAGNTTLTATDATLIGYHAGTALTTSVGLTAVGANAAASLTTSARCTAIGFNALTTNATGGADCTAVGYEALKVTTINSNTAVGSQACTATTNGSDMTAIGDKALKAMVNAASCTAVGSSALVLSTSGNNTAIGAFAGSVNVSGSSNIFIGESAGDATANNVSNRFVAGSNSSPIATVFIGNGETNGTPQAIVYKATGGSGANVAGASFTIAGGAGTGTGIGGSIIFRTAAATTSSSTANALADALTIDQKANLVLGTAALATTATDGFLYVASCAGTPTGVPTAFTGRVPIEIDTTGGKFWAYYGGAWHFTLLT